MISDIANYADDTTPYECAPYYYDKLKENLELTIYKIFSWFKYNNFKANSNVIFYYRPISLLLQVSLLQSLKVVIRKNF